MQIRDELKKDRKAVHVVNATAFETEAEANLVDALREELNQIVSLVATTNGDIIGHIMFTPVTLTGHPDISIMGLAPMAVSIEHQRKGVGSELIMAGLEKCKNQGAGAIVVLGDPAYYSRFGFKPSTIFGIGCEYEVPEEAFMAKALIPDYLKEKTGIIHYHEIFKSV